MRSNYLLSVTSLSALLLLITCGLLGSRVHSVIFLDEPLLGSDEDRPSCLHSHLGLVEADRVEKEILRYMNNTFVHAMEKFQNATKASNETTKDEKKKDAPRYKQLRVDEHIEYSKETVEEFLNSLKKLLESRSLEVVNKSKNSTEPHPFEHIVNTFQFIHRFIKDTRGLIKRVLHYENSGRAFRNLASFIKDVIVKTQCSISERQFTEFKQYLVLSWQVHGLTFQDFLAGQVRDIHGKTLPSLRGKVSMEETLSLLPALCHNDISSYPTAVVQSACLIWSSQIWNQWSKEFEKPENRPIHRSFIRQYSRALSEAGRFTEALNLLNGFKDKYSATDGAFCKPVERDIAFIKDQEERKKQSSEEPNKTSTEGDTRTSGDNEEAQAHAEKLKVREQFWTNFTADSSLLTKATLPQGSTCFYYIYPRQPVLRYKVELINKRKPVLYQIYNVVSKEEMEEIQKLLTASIASPRHQYASLSVFYQQNIGLYKSLQLKKVVQRVDRITRAAVRSSSLVASNVLVRNSAFGNYVPWNLFRQPPKRLYEEVQGSTCLMFLSDVLVGGQVYFPELKLAVLPQKGSLLFWYDDISEDGSKVNLHEPIDIPLLVGSKWVALRRVEEVSGGTCAKKM